MTSLYIFKGVKMFYNKNLIRLGSTTSVVKLAFPNLFAKLDKAKHSIFADIISYGITDAILGDSPIYSSMYTNVIQKTKGNITLSDESYFRPSNSIPGIVGGNILFNGSIDYDDIASHLTMILSKYGNERDLYNSIHLDLQDETGKEPLSKVIQKEMLSYNKSKAQTFMEEAFEEGLNLARENMIRITSQQTKSAKIINHAITFESNKIKVAIPIMITFTLEGVRMLDEED
jgi:hypothetical protein